MLHVLIWEGARREIPEGCARFVGCRWGTESEVRVRRGLGRIWMYWAVRVDSPIAVAREEPARSSRNEVKENVLIWLSESLHSLIKEGDPPEPPGRLIQGEAFLNPKMSL